MKKLFKNKKQNDTFQTNVFNVENQYIQHGNDNTQVIGDSSEIHIKPEPEKKWVIIIERILAAAAAIATIISLVLVVLGNNRTITSISINQLALEMKVGETAQLIVKAICSDNSETDNILWISSNPSVVEVDQDGRLIAVAAGEVIITAQAIVDKDTKNVSCSVKVLAPPSGYSISLSAYNVWLFEKFNVIVTPYGEDITEIWLYAKAPSGNVDDFQLDSSGRGTYRIETEKGLWEIYAVIKNKAGVYEPSKPEDVVYIEVK